MIPFDAADPFPLLPLNSYSYKEAQDHSILVDEWLGLRTAEIESQVRALPPEHSPRHQNWQHISVQAMQTPYVEFRNILELLDIPAHAHIVDLGAAYSRMGFILSRHYPTVRFDGYELESLRVQESKRVFQKFRHAGFNFHTADLSAPDFSFPLADIYFIFDYGSEKDVRKTLNDLRERSRTKPIRVVARGRLSRFLIHQEHPWLAQVNEPRHFDFFSIYQS